MMVSMSYLTVRVTHRLNFPDYYMATLEVKIPIYYAHKQRYALEESYSKLREATQNYQAAQQQPRSRISISPFRAASAFC